MSRLLASCLGAFALLFGSACGAPSPPAPPVATPATAPVEAAAGTSYPVTVNDAFGRSVSVARKPERVACYAIACPDLLYALGTSPIAVSGTTLYAELLFGQSAASIPVISAVGALPNFEDVANARPDLVLFSPPDARDGLAPISPAYQVNYTKGIQGTIDDLHNVARLLDRQAQAQTEESRFRERLAAYKARSPGDLRVMVVFAAANNVTVQLRASIVGSVLAEVTQYPWAPPPSGEGAYIGTFPLNFETLLEQDPDAILVPEFSFDTRISQAQLDLRMAMESSPLWKELSAVRNGRVYFIDRRILDTYSTATATRMLDTVMPLLYPQAFPQALP